jgi:transketolase
MIMRDSFANTLSDLAEQHEDIVVLAADISPVGKIGDFAKKHPNRFINVGVAEQSMIGIGAGLAIKGFRPFCYTIATFSVFRPYEFLRIDLGYQNLPVTIVGMGAGISYSTLGFTHHAQEDIAICSTIPNFEIWTPFDSNSTSLCLQQIVNQSDAPTYLRLGKSGEPVLKTFGNISSVENPEIVIAYHLLEPKIDADVVFITYGPISKTAIEVAAELCTLGIKTDVVSVIRLQPINWDEILNSYKPNTMIVVVEEHIEEGGLAAKLSLFLQTRNFHMRLINFALPKLSLHLFGEKDWLLENLGLSTQKIVQEVINHLRLSVKINLNKY